MGRGGVLVGVGDGERTNGNFLFLMGTFSMASLNRHPRIGTPSCKQKLEVRRITINGFIIPAALCIYANTQRKNEHSQIQKLKRPPPFLDPYQSDPHYLSSFLKTVLLVTTHKNRSHTNN